MSSRSTAGKCPLANRSSQRFTRDLQEPVSHEDRKPDQQDAYCVAKWLTETDERRFLEQYFAPPLTVEERKVADLEGRILGPCRMQGANLVKQPKGNHMSYIRIGAIVFSLFAIAAFVRASESDELREMLHRAGESE